ncbi:MAG: TetR family transcriptional regulator [Bifidobacteriaceae bacterium]|nr:TetR family transcriptional regulator [Bifidobacteriaceae bacterium]
MHTDKGDLTAKARIRDAAMLAFATHGFRVPLRRIAEDAGVSVALITHHYGTKEALRQVCDDYVLDRYEDIKLMAVADPHSIENELTDMSEASVATVYMVQCFLDPSATTRAFFDRYIDRVRKVLQVSCDAGMIRTEVMNEESIRLLAMRTIGHVVAEYALDPPADPRRFIDDTYTLPTMAALMELYRGGVFTDSPTIDQYLEVLRARSGDNNA